VNSMKFSGKDCNYCVFSTPIKCAVNMVSPLVEIKDQCRCTVYWQTECIRILSRCNLLSAS